MGGVIAMVLIAVSPASAQTPAAGAAAATVAGPSPGTIMRDAKGAMVSYTASTGKTYKMGDTIRLGVPKRIEGSYMNIRTAAAKRHVWDGSDHMEGKYAGLSFRIEGMYAGGGILEGKSAPPIVYFYFKVRGLFGGLYEIAVEPALMQQEFQ
jgi:hypothetical protein